MAQIKGWQLEGGYDSWKPELDYWELDQALKMTLKLDEETEHWKVWLIENLSKTTRFI